MNHPSASYAVTESGHVGDIRRRALMLARDAEFDETEAGKVGIVATELANNIVKHAGTGRILLRGMRHEGVTGVEIMALDSGQGMYDVGRCLEDGYSTAGSPGTGLGAVVRMSEAFDIYSVPQKGTAVLSRLWAKKFPCPPYNIGGISVPVTGETQCGDAWGFHAFGNKIAMIAADGLGHGPLAAHASNKAVEAFHAHAEETPAAILRAVHGALLSTRGAAVAVAVIDAAQGELRYAAIGNISGMMFDGQKIRGLVTLNGTVGHTLYKVQEIPYPWTSESWAVLHSDGLLNRWKIENYPGLLRCHPALIAGILYRDFERGRDDTMVVTVSNRQG
jgi:anti-sigma regulatory factor (Ser/Thr protein kinase)